MIKIVGLLNLWYLPMVVSVGVKIRRQQKGLLPRVIDMFHLVPPEHWVHCCIVQGQDITLEYQAVGRSLPFYGIS